MLLLWKVEKQRHRDRYVQNILMTLFLIRFDVIWWRIRPHSNPYVSHALGARLCREVVSGALRKYKTAYKYKFVICIGLGGAGFRHVCTLERSPHEKRGARGLVLCPRIELLYS